ncbi:Hypothetical protein FKW44_022691 [Caligus rogercresseyi]|uniref:Uncharacterized protein n=1 Tax=Caligus rogercresseyi TaxID=217165 RepID=A0A7T8GND2_CALRO|nr:Hypothetical protein FKW44_022691 [Caligus rogercresseyi]
MPDHAEEQTSHLSLLWILWSVSMFFLHAVEAALWSDMIRIQRLWDGTRLEGDHPPTALPELWPWEGRHSRFGALHPL